MPEWYTILKTFLQDFGFPVAVTAYLLYRDYKFMGGLTGLMSRFDAWMDAQGVPATPTKLTKGA